MIHVLGEETPYIAPRQFETESDSGERDEKLLEALHSISKAPLLDRGDIRLAMQEVSGRFDEVTAKHHAEIVARLLTFLLSCLMIADRVYRIVSVLPSCSPRPLGCIHRLRSIIRHRPQSKS